MSKHQKALDRLCAIPPPADLKWNELKALLEHLGYHMLKNSGSRRKFFHAEKKALVICHEPHPSPVVDKGCVVGVVEHLRCLWIHQKVAMDTLKFKEYEGTAEIDMSRRVCHGRILFIDDLVTYQASDPTGLQAEFEAAVEDYIATCAQVGKEPQRPFKGLFNVRVPPSLHRAAAMRAVCDDVALNDVVVRALDAFLNVRTEVNHTVTVTFEAPPRMIKTVQAVASDNVQWGTSNVH